MFKYDTLASEHTDSPFDSAQPLSFTQTGTSASSVSIVPVRGAPRLLTSTPSDNAIGGVGTTGVVVTLNFNEAMARSTQGVIFVTDGAVQTIIDRVTGQPTMRVVGGTDTHVIPVSDTSRVAISGNTVQVHVDGSLVAGRNYSVLMHKGVLTDLGGTPFAGISSPSTLNFTPSTGSGPTLLSYNLGDAELRTGKHLNVTLVFSEAIQSLNAGAFNIPNGSLTGFSTSDGGTTWTAVLSPNANVLDASNQLGLDGTKISALDGRTGNGNHNSGNYAVDTLVEAYVDSAISIIDNGLSPSDLVTTQALQTISGTYTGTMAATDRLELFINDVVIHPDNIVINTATRTWSYTGTAREDLNIVKASIVNSLGHNSAVAKLTFDLDTAGPMLTDGDAYGGVNHAKPLTLVFNEAVHWTDGSKMTLNGNSATVEIDKSQLTISSDQMTLTIPASLHQMIANTVYTLSLPATMTDADGNGRGDAPVYLDTTPDSAIPTTALAQVTSADGNYGIGDGVTIVMHFNETVKIAGAPTLLLETGSTDRSAVYLSGDGTTDLVFRYTVQAGDSVSNLSLASSAGLVGAVRDLAGNLLDAASITFTALAKSGGGAPSIYVDGIAPATLGAPNLDAASDSGVSSTDNITSDLTPTFSGSGAIANTLMQLLRGKDVVATGNADGSGNWSLTASPQVAGSYDFTVKQFDDVDNPSAASATLSVTLDTSAPAVNSRSTITDGVLKVQFNENISFTSGSLNVYNSSNVLVHTYLPGSAKVSIGAGTFGDSSLLTLAPDFVSGTYYLQSSADAIQDLAGNFTVELVGVIDPTYVVLRVI